MSAQPLRPDTRRDAILTVSAVPVCVLQAEEASLSEVRAKISQLAMEMQGQRANADLQASVAVQLSALAKLSA